MGIMGESSEASKRSEPLEKAMKAFFKMLRMYD